MNRIVLLATLSLTASCACPAQTHPLDPLSKEEIAAAVSLLKAGGKITQVSRFPLLVLDEPRKDELSDTPPRRAFAIVFERAANRTFEAVVDLRSRSIVSWKQIRGVQPPILGEEIALTEKIVRADPGWRQAMRKRGISDFGKVQIDPWTAGYHGAPEDDGAAACAAFPPTGETPGAPICARSRVWWLTSTSPPARSSSLSIRE